MRDDTLRRGLGLLGRAIRHEPFIFALALGGGAVYGVMTVASAWVLGRVTDQVVLPAFQDGRTTTGALSGAALAILGVAVLKAAGIVGRRLGAGVMQYRLQARYRRAVTQQYLRLPPSWHQQHPTGRRCPAANGNGSRRPGHWCAGRGRWCSTTAPRQSTHGSRRQSWPASVTGPATATPGR